MHLTWNKKLALIIMLCNALSITKCNVSVSHRSEQLSVSQHFEHNYFPSGSNESLSCKPYKNRTERNKWNATWRKGNQELNETSPRLRLYNLSMSDAGTYTALVSNNSFAKNCTFNVTIIKRSRTPPKIIYLSPNKTAHVGECVILNCTVESELTPYVTWEINCTLGEGDDVGNQCANNSHRIGVPDDINLLVIPSFNLSDVGSYTCIAATALGNVSNTTWVNLAIPDENGSFASSEEGEHTSSTLEL